MRDPGESAGLSRHSGPRTVSRHIAPEVFLVTKKGQEELILPGGQGGKGNSHFATSTRQAPRFAIDGEKGIEKELILELKLLADVGLV